MNALTARDEALVGLAAAIGSNCIPCAERHVALARQAGLGDGQIEAAIALADKIRQVPARKVLAGAAALLASPATAIQPCNELDSGAAPATTSGCC